MASRPVAQQSELLTSWKEIACYLGKGVRTVQRWEEQFGLPVRRPNAKAKGVVQTTRQELDHWLESRWSPRHRENRTSEHTIPKGLNDIRKNMEQAAHLRQSNRELLQEIRRSLKSVVEECQTMSRNITSVPKAE